MHTSNSVTLLLAVVFAFSFTTTSEVVAQPPDIDFAYKPIYTQSQPESVFAQRRTHIANALDNKMMALVFSADKRNRQNDVYYPYRQSSNMLYLTGIEVPDIILMIAKSEDSVHQIVFCRERNIRAEVWSGLRPGLDGIRAKGFSDVRPIETFSAVMDSILTPEWIVCVESTLPTPIVVNPVSQEPHYMSEAGRTYLREKWPNIGVNTSILQRLLGNMRVRKNEYEVQLLNTAVGITGESYSDVMKLVQPGLTEHQVRAHIEFGFAKRGAQTVGFPSIVATGNNTCIVHYTEATDTLQDGDLLLMDCGAEFDGYTADVTRTIPVNGTFSREQALVYTLVLKAQDSAIAACTVGANFRDPGQIATTIIANGLLELGITSSKDETRWYFPHGTSHYLGLDVHDITTTYALDAGSVLTVEPGIYIPVGSPCDPKWWGIGIRIEDDVLVTKNGPVNLSEQIPRTIEAIEHTMQ